MASVISQVEPATPHLREPALADKRYSLEVKYLCPSYQTGPQKDPPSLRPE